MDIYRKLQLTEAAFYRWKRKFHGLGVSELRELKPPARLESEGETAGRGSYTRQSHSAGAASARAATARLGLTGNSCPPTTGRGGDNGLT